MRITPVLVATAASAVALAAPAAVPAASAASLGSVGVVSFVANSPTSLSLDWSSVRGARGYEVFSSTNLAMSGARLAGTRTGSAATITGLTPGVTYCFKVRARTGSSYGPRSAVTCKPTVRERMTPDVAARVTGGVSSYAVMTFNVCSDACSGWGSTRWAAANKVIANRQPDVLALQEAGSFTTPPPGYSATSVKNAKRLFYKTSRFTLASGRTGWMQMGPSRYAVWAELVDRTNGKHTIFTSVHTSFASADFAKRGAEVRSLMAQVNQLNYGRLPVVYAGDFNSHKHRGTYDPATGFGVEDNVGLAFAQAGYYDAYDLASSLKRSNWNSFSGLKSVPTIGRTWGDHVDHVFVVPGRAVVSRWMNASLYSGSRYATPAPSDHSPVMVDLTVG